MRVISIDVGIKNLAYCILEGSDKNNYKIIQWDVINLCGSEHLCNCTLKPKIKKGKNIVINQLIIEPLAVLCNKKASFVKIKYSYTNYYCQTHAKLS